MQPPRLALRTRLNGEVLDLDTPALIVSNNVYGRDHLPYADRLDQGVLGIYACTSTRPADLALLSLEALLGRWHDNGCVTVLTAKSVSIERRRARKKTVTATLDGELTSLPTPVTATIRPGALTVLVPGSAEGAEH
jgi:diacylglycerol kinase family enzyme